MLSEPARNAPALFPPERCRAYGSRRSFLQLALAALLLGTAAAAPSAGGKTTLKIIALGDSLTAGFGLPLEAAFPAVLERKLKGEGYDVSIANAGVSGDTASGGLARLDWAIGQDADGVILELGANDMLRGADPEITKAALDSVLAKLKERGIKALIAGMNATPSYGREYKARFDAIYPALARKYAAPLYPFFLEGVAGDASLTLGDGLHPNAAGVERIVNGILPLARAFLESLGARPLAANKGPAGAKNSP
jgi:acyl-CoA thioesterase-1